MKREKQKNEGISVAYSYAAMLDIAARIAMVLLAGTFLIYITGIIPARIAPSMLPAYWHLPLAEFNTAVGVTNGWSWIASLPLSDNLCIAAVAFLVSVTAVCYIRILPKLLVMKDHIYAVIAVLEVIVLVLAAAGIFHGGH